MLAKNFRRLMKDDRFKKKFSERVRLMKDVRPQCSLIKAQKAKAKAKKEVPRQVDHGSRPAAQTPWYQAPYHQAPRYQAPWSHGPRYQASQDQRPRKRFEPANHSGNSKNKSKQFRRSG
jgi:hypothetical protein